MTAPTRNHYSYSNLNDLLSFWTLCNLEEIQMFVKITYFRYWVVCTMGDHR